MYQVAKASQLAPLRTNPIPQPDTLLSEPSLRRPSLSPLNPTRAALDCLASPSFHLFPNAAHLCLTSRSFLFFPRKKKTQWPALPHPSCDVCPLLEHSLTCEPIAGEHWPPKCRARLDVPETVAKESLPKASKNKSRNQINLHLYTLTPSPNPTRCTLNPTRAVLLYLI